MPKRVRAVIIKDGEIILINRVKKGESYWVLPGGGVEANESDEETIKRECKEELGATIRVNKLFFEKTSDKPETLGQLEMYYLCDITHGKVGTGKGPEFQPDTQYEGEYKISWVDLRKLPSLNLLPKEVKDKITDYGF